jgi:hypothetical protein
MAQMGITLTADNLGSNHEMTRIFDLFYAILRNGLPVAGPATARIKF